MPKNDTNNELKIFLWAVPKDPTDEKPRRFDFDLWVHSDDHWDNRAFFVHEVTVITPLPTDEDLIQRAITSLKNRIDGKVKKREEKQRESDIEIARLESQIASLQLIEHQPQE